MNIIFQKQATFLLVLGITTAACQPQYPPIEELLIDVSVFPEGWIEDVEGPGADPSAPWGGIRSVERTTLFFHSPTAGAFEQIERYNEFEQASQEFDKQKAFSQDERDFIPDELSFKDIGANQYHFACVRQPQYPYPFLGCIYIAQHGTYVVNFNFGWNLDAMSASELESILRAIDEKMMAFRK